MAQEGLRTSGYRDYVNYNLAKQDNRERGTSFHWELIFTSKPTGIYLPPDTVMKLRIQKVDKVPKVEIGALLETEIHGWKFFQYGQNDYSGEFGVSGIDFIDESVEYAFRELCYETDRPLDHTAKPKAELLWDAELIEFNNQDIPIHKWIMKDCLVSEYSAEKTFDNKKELNGEFSVSWKASLITEAQLNTSSLM